MDIHVEIVGGELLLTGGREAQGPMTWSKSHSRSPTPHRSFRRCARAAGRSAANRSRGPVRKEIPEKSRVVAGCCADRWPCAAEARVEEILLRQAPADPFAVAAEGSAASLRPAASPGSSTASESLPADPRISVASAAGRRRQGWSPVRRRNSLCVSAVLELIGVAGHVDRIEPEHVLESYRSR